MKKINILVDGNFIFHSAYSIYVGWNKTNAFPNKKDEVAFVQSVANNFFATLRQLPKGGEVIFTIDSRSWRKAIDIPDHPGYKSGRVDKDGNKGAMTPETAATFYRLIDEFTKYLGRVGIIISRIGGAEGDDLIYRWSDYFFKKGECSIIVSGDKDLTQLVKISDNAQSWTIQWNNKNNSARFKNTIYTPMGWQSNYLSLADEIDIFNFSIGNAKEDILKLIRDQQITLVTVHPDDVIMGKILAGDDGDDVPPVWINRNWKNKKGEQRDVRMTGKKPAEALELLAESHNIDQTNYMSKWDNHDFMQDAAGLVLRLTKDIDGAAERETVIEAMRRNAQLVWLQEDQLPYNLLAEMDHHIEKTIATNVTQRHKWNRDGIFSGSRFAEDAVPDKYDPFIGVEIPD